MSEAGVMGPVKAPLDQLIETGGDSAYRALVKTVWRDGQLTPEAPAEVPALVAALSALRPRVQAQLAILLGLLVEAAVAADPPAADVRDAVVAAVPTCTKLLADEAGDAPRDLALMYLLSHFPERRVEIMDGAARSGADADDLTRLDRCLQLYATAGGAARWNLGRVFPSPAVWAVTEQERATQPDLADWLELPPERAAALWQAETDALIAYSGAKACWATTHGAPAPWVRAASSPPAALSGPAERGAASAPATVDAASPLGGHEDAMWCVTCSGALTSSGVAQVRCVDCATVFEAVDGVLHIVDAPVPRADPLLAGRYERGLRAGFVRIMGANWGDAVSVADEERYLRERVRPVAGAVLDVAAGAGRWTGILVRLFGAERVIALDLSVGMLRELHRKLPVVLAVRASALELPFADASLGAVNCWNALQALPDPEQAICEVGRCLRPGGTFTLMTFRPVPDPMYRHFQRQLQRQADRGAFEPAEVQQWLTAAGMVVRDVSGPGGFLLVTAEKLA